MCSKEFSLLTAYIYKLSFWGHSYLQFTRQVPHNGHCSSLNKNHHESALKFLNQALKNIREHPSVPLTVLRQATCIYTYHSTSLNSWTHTASLAPSEGKCKCCFLSPWKVCCILHAYYISHCIKANKSWKKRRLLWKYNKISQDHAYFCTILVGSSNIFYIG